MNRKVFLAAAFTAGVVFAFIPSTGTISVKTESPFQTHGR